HNGRFVSRPEQSSVVAGTDLGAADIISTVEFDHTGNYLATGDKGGRVVLFERNDSVSLLQKTFGTAAAPSFFPCIMSNRLSCRRKLANTSSIPNSNRTSRNSTT